MNTPGVDATTAQMLAWRLGRHHLVAGAPSVWDVVGRLTAVPAWSGDADLAVRRRLAEPEPGAVDRALSKGELIRTYAFRGATHLMTAADAGVYLAVRGAGRQWELPSWQTHYGLRPQDWSTLRETVRAALTDGPISHGELVDAVTAQPRFRHLRPGLSDPSHTLLKPFAWQGDLCLGPARDGRATFQSPLASPWWAGLTPLDEAGPRAISAYLAAYGPATRAHVHYWLAAGLGAGRKRLDGWLAGLVDDAVVEIRVDDEPMLHVRAWVDDLVAQPPDAEIVLLPGYDQWVLGVGTSDERIVPATRRSRVSHGANLVLHGGRLAGTWKAAETQLRIAWFTEAGSPPRARIDTEAERLAGLLGRELDVIITVD